MIEPGDVITAHYALALERGQPLESTFGESPERFVYGRGEFPAALEQRLAQLEVGEESEFLLPAAEAVFGTWEEGKRQTVERAGFSDGQCRPGALVEFETPGGERVSGRIEFVDGDKVLVDFNHPLAGRDVHCRLQLVSVQKSGQSS